MNKFIIICFMFFSFNACSLTNNDLIKIYKTIVKANNLKEVKDISVDFFNQDLNAWVDPEFKLTVTRGSVKKLDKDELAFVIGHELAHNQFDDMHNNLFGKYNEDRADFYGRLFAEKAGFNRCKMANFFIKRYKLHGNQGGFFDPHSSNLLRYKRLYEGCS